MSLGVSEATAETIPGDPTHQAVNLADNERVLLSSRGAGQPYLIAVKLRGETGTLHLRTYLEDPVGTYEWARTALLPPEIQSLVAKTSRGNALAWSKIYNPGTSPQLFFDPTRNHDAWGQGPLLPKAASAPAGNISPQLQPGFAVLPDGDAAAEALSISDVEVEAFRQQIHNENYEVDDAYSTTRTRGSAQRAFSDHVKKNYKSQCAISGITTKHFLVASHIVPWSQDKSIRLDPSNGICLSLLIDKAFENGYLTIGDDLKVSINWKKTSGDKKLNDALKIYDGQQLTVPSKFPPNIDYLRRRRKLVALLA